MDGKNGKDRALDCYSGEVVMPLVKAEIAPITTKKSQPDPRWRLYPRARDALGAVLDALGARNVLLPAYVGWSSREGSGVFDPVQERALNSRFYKMRSDLTVDLEDLGLLLEAVPQASVLILIHYFGRPDPSLERIVRLARSHQITVVEDAAHAYFSAEVSGSCGKSGDAVFYSIHKMFDVSEGGVLKLNTADLETRIPEGASGQVHNAGWTCVFGEPLDAHAIARIRNYAAVARKVEQLAPTVVPLWEKLPEGTVPQTFPVRVASNALRDRLYFGLKREGFVVSSLYHTLISPLKESDFPASFSTSRTIFNLPVAPGMTEADIERLGQSMAAIVGHVI